MIGWLIMGMFGVTFLTLALVVTGYGWVTARATPLMIIGLQVFALGHFVSIGDTVFSIVFFVTTGLCVLTYVFFEPVAALPPAKRFP